MGPPREDTIQTQGRLLKQDSEGTKQILYLLLKTGLAVLIHQRTISKAPLMIASAPLSISLKPIWIYWIPISINSPYY